LGVFLLYIFSMDSSFMMWYSKSLKDIYCRCILILTINKNVSTFHVVSIKWCDVEKNIIVIDWQCKIILHCPCIFFIIVIYFLFWLMKLFYKLHVLSKSFYKFFFSFQYISTELYLGASLNPSLLHVSLSRKQLTNWQIDFNLSS
jgi:hypothetical protein